jgi:hypothetical protein
MLTSFTSEAWSQRYLIQFIVCDYVLLMLCQLLLPSRVREFKTNSHVPAFTLCRLEATQLTYVLYAFCTIHMNVANALCYSTSMGIHCTRTVVWDSELRLGSLCQKVATTFKYVISTFSAAQSHCFTECRNLQDVRVWKRRTCNALCLQLRMATWAWTQLLAHTVCPNDTLLCCVTCCGFHCRCQSVFVLSQDGPSELSRSENGTEFFLLFWLTN